MNRSPPTPYGEHGFQVEVEAQLLQLAHQGLRLGARHDVQLQPLFDLAQVRIELSAEGCEVPGVVRLQEQAARLSRTGRFCIQ